MNQAITMLSPYIVTKCNNITKNPKVLKKCAVIHDTKEKVQRSIGK